MGRNVLLIGIGQTGCTVCELFLNKMNKDGLKATAIAIDTDERTLSALGENVRTIPLVDRGSLFSVVERLGRENVSNWFPCEYTEDCTEFAKALRMDCGSNQWRMKAYLSFVSFMAKPQNVDKLHAALDAAAAASDGEEMDVYTVASLAGGTGSGLFLPVSLYVKNYFESNGIALGQRRAILVMPDIYEHCYSAEQQVKSRANAYAALREYHALLRCACSSEKAQEDSFAWPVSFDLVLDTPDDPSVLFDSAREEYRTPAAGPFDRVYLLERVPSVVSVGAHAEMIADVMVSFCKVAEKPSENKKAEKAADAIFGGFSLTYVKYPIESVVSYIAKRQMKEFFAQETSWIHKITDAELSRRRGEAKLYGRQFVETTEHYVDALLEGVDLLLEESGTPLSLIGRNPDEFVRDRSGDDVFRFECLPAISELINGALACEAGETLEQWITKPASVFADAESDEDEKKKKKQKKKSKKEQRLETAQLALDCGKLLTAVYRHGLNAAVDEKDRLVKALLATEPEDGQFSFVEHVLKQNGTYLHPAYALLRLCIVRKEIGGICGNSPYSVLDEPDSKTAELSDGMLAIRSTVRGMTKYSKANEERFKALIFDEDGEYAKLADDRHTFMLDLRDVFERMTQKLKVFCYMTVLEVVDDLIGRYRDFISVLHGLNDELVAEEKLALLTHSGANGNVVYVGSSCEEKREAYATYGKQYRADADAVAAYTAKIGEYVCEAILEKDADTTPRQMLLETLGRVERVFVEQCEDSAFYREQLDKNILQMILASSAKRGTGITLSRVFNGRPISLHVKMPEQHREYQAMQTRIVAILDDEIASYLSAEAALTRGKAPKEYMEQLMYTAGEYLGEVEFAACVGKRTMALRCETVNMRLSFAEAINESAGGACYTSYLRAKENRTRFCTEMWNPYLTIHRGGTAVLPYIDLQMQKQYETDVCRAVIHALATDGLYTEVLEGETVYVRRVGVVSEPLWISDSAIPTSRPADMLRWAYDHPEWVAPYAERFKEKEAKACMCIPANVRNHANLRTVSATIARSEVLATVTAFALPLMASLLPEDDSIDPCFAVCLAGLSYTALEMLCRRAYANTDEYFVAVYNRCVNRIAGALAESVGRASAERIFSWLNARGYFGYYNELGVRVNYQFDWLSEAEAYESETDEDAQEDADSADDGESQET